MSEDEDVDMNNDDTGANRKIVSFVITVIATIGVFAAIAYNSSRVAASSHNPLEPIEPILYPDVAVVRVAKGDYQAVVTGYGEARPRYELALTAEVSGHVTELAEELASGVRVAKGDTLATLDDTDFERALAGAKAAVAEARLRLIEEQRESDRARRRSGAAPPALAERRIAAARAKLEQATWELAKARRDLEKTRIRAPFNALVVTRDVQPGSYVRVGTPIASLYSTDRLEIVVPLSAEQWSNLPPAASLAGRKWPVTLTGAESRFNWRGYVDRIERHLDSASRQRSLVIAVERPLERERPLYPGTFVKARIEGASRAGLWRIPASSITRDGAIWVVAPDNVLARFNADSVYEADRYSYVQPPAGMDSASIVLRPLNSYVVGMQVSPRAEG